MNEKELKNILKEVSEYFGLPSISVSILINGIEVNSAYGMSNIESKIPASPDTIYAIASCTKAFTSFVICSLADEGKLDLDEKVKKYIPEFKMQDKYAEENITIRDILCHRSGLPRHDISMYTWEGFEPSKIFDMVSGLTPSFPLRSRFHYQNHMFLLAGELAARVANKSYKDLVEERILKPLGMNSTYLYGDEINMDDPNLSIPYTGSYPNCIRMYRDYSSFPAGDGSIYSTTRDMLKWLKFQLYGDENIISNKYLREMQKSQINIGENDGIFDIKLQEISSPTYGLGWFVYKYWGKTLIHHGGTVGGYKALQLIVPESDIAVSILMNGDGIGAREGAGFTILDELLGVKSNRDFEKYVKIYIPEEKSEVESRKIEEVPFDSKEYIGEYINEGYGTLSFHDDKGHLMLHISALGADFELKCIRLDKFLISFDVYGLSFETSFLRNEEGKVISIDIPFEPEAREEIRFKKL